MTRALITAALSQAALEELEHRFGWELITLPGDTQLSDSASLAPYEPAAVDVLVIEADPVDAATMDLLPRLSLLACLRGNPVNVDIAQATGRGILVVHAPGRNAEAVADLALGLIFSCVRQIAQAHHLIRTRRLTEDRPHHRQRADVIWRPSNPDDPVPYVVFKGPELATLTLGLLGFGAIGERVATKALGLEMRVLAHDPFVTDGRIAGHGVRPVTFEQLLAESDVVSLHAPGQAGRPLVGAPQLALMKPTAYLINTARASVLDYDALAAALREHRLAGAGLDVFPDEPLSSNSPLLELANVTLTPHIGGASTNVVHRQSELLLTSLRALAAGNPSGAFIRNPDVLDATDGSIMSMLGPPRTRPNARAIPADGN
jgi:D-3-phosphoglycerate dehydrogenase / 2-oxoglutarate reductase